MVDGVSPRSSPGDPLKQDTRSGMTQAMARPDPHSVTDDAQPSTRHIEWDASVDFASKRLTATVTLHFREPASTATPLDLDARGLEVSGVNDLSGAALKW